MHSWGWTAKKDGGSTSGTHYVQRVKLHLASREGFDPHAIAPLPPGLTPLEIIGSYLRAMKTEIFNNLKAKSIEVPPAHVRWCLTVPAIWSLGARDTMTKAAQIAGMVSGDMCPPGEGSYHELEIVPEPEAASLYCLFSLQEAMSNMDQFADAE